MDQLERFQRSLESASNVVEEFINRDKLRRPVVDRERPPLDSKWIDTEVDLHVVEFCTDSIELARHPCPLILRQSQRLRLELRQQFRGGHVCRVATAFVVVDRAASEAGDALSAKKSPLSRWFPRPGLVSASRDG